MAKLGVVCASAISVAALAWAPSVGVARALQKGPAMTSDASTTTANEALVRRLYACIQNNDAEGFKALVSAEHTDHSNGRNGPAGFVAAAQNLHRAYSDFRITLEAVVASGDLVVVQWRETGTHTGQFFNLRPTNKPFSSTGLNMYRIADGKIVESWIAVDPKTFRAQMEAQAALPEL